MQRGFVEKQTLAESEYAEIETYEVDAPILLDGIGDTASYQKLEFERLEEKSFVGFDSLTKPWLLNILSTASCNHGFASVIATLLCK